MLEDTMSDKYFCNRQHWKWDLQIGYLSKTKKLSNYDIENCWWYVTKIMKYETKKYMLYLKEYFNWKADGNLTPVIRD